MILIFYVFALVVLINDVYLVARRSAPCVTSRVLCVLGSCSCTVDYYTVLYCTAGIVLYFRYCTVLQVLYCSSGTVQYCPVLQFMYFTALYCRY